MEKHISKIEKLNISTEPIQQPEGTASFILNGQYDFKGFIRNENSNEIVDSLPTNYIPLGSVYKGDDELIVLSRDDSGNSEIGIINKDGIYTTHVNNTCLNFWNPIDIIHRVRLGCEDVIYFTEKGNPVRHFNFARPDTFKTNGSWDCNKFKVFPDYDVPCFDDIEVTTGGSVESGTYNFDIQLLDSDKNQTNWIYSSQLVSIYNSTLSGSYHNIEGSSNSESDLLGGTSEVNKAIKLTLSNLDEDYTYYRIAVIQAAGNTGEVSKILVSPEQSITQDTFIFDGNLTGYTETTLEELRIGKLDIEFAEHIEQLENRLILANIKGKQINWCEFQSYASQICTTYSIHEISASDQYDIGNSKNPNTYWEKMSGMGDEVYARGIVYVFDDGFESPVYHIPGRPKDRFPCSETTCTEQLPFAPDSTVLTTWTSDMAHLYSEDEYNALTEAEKLETWQVYNTARSNGDGTGDMSYWECSNATYQARENCNGEDYWGVDYCGNALADQPIRHHKYPSRYIEPHIRGGTLNEVTTSLYTTITIKDGETPVPGTTYTLTINYTKNSVAQTKYILLDDGNTPMYNNLVDSCQCDIGDMAIVSYSIDNSGGDIFDVAFSESQSSTTTADATILRLLGVTFNNITYPHPDIVGHYFVRGERDESNRTILDKGIAGRMRYGEPGNGLYKYLTFSYFTNGNNDEETNYLLTPRFMYNQESLNPSYITVENEFDYNYRELSLKDNDGVGWIDTDTLIEVRRQYYNGLTDIVPTNHKVDNNIILDGLSFEENYKPGIKAYNLSHTNRVQVIDTDSAIPKNGHDVPYVSLKRTTDIYCNLDAVTYMRTHNCMLVGDTATIYGDDVFITKMNTANTLFREFYDGFLDDLLKIVLIAGAAVAVFLTAGAAAALLGVAVSVIEVAAVVAGTIGVTAQAVSAVMNAYKDSGLEDMADDNELDSLKTKVGSFTAYANEYLDGIYVESEVNTGLRQSQNNECGTFYKEDQDLLDYFGSKIMYYNEDNDWLEPKPVICPEIYHYNKDYSRENTISIYYPLLSSFNCCSDCLEEHPNRVHYSEQSFQEETSDNYRVFYANNYRDLEAERGEITDLLRRHNNLYIFTKEGLWQLPQNIQERITGEIVSFIGTGEFFAIPPRLVMDDALGSAGTQDKWSIIKTQYGVVFANEIEHKIYRFTDKIEEISEEIELFTNEYLVNNFENQFERVLGIEYPHADNYTHVDGTGIHTGYDFVNKRIIITKKDYKLLSEDFIALSTDTPIEEGSIVYDVENDVFFVYLNGVQTTIHLDNPDYFENKSFSISYCFENNAWVSFHSYLPNMYGSTPNNFYSFNGDSNIWKHNVDGNYQTYYSTLNPHIVEYISVSNPIQTRLFDQITIQTSATKNDAEINDVTFNKLLLYNSRQSSGIIDLVVSTKDSDYLLNQIKNSPTQILIDKHEGDWNINDFVDYVTQKDLPLFKKDWNNLSTEYYIDKVPNAAILDTNKEWTDLENFRDKYLIVRLIFSTFDDIQLVTNYSVELENNSIR